MLRQMNRIGWVVLTVIFSSLCFVLAFFYITGSVKKSKPEIVLTSTPTTSTVTWYTSIPKIHADRIANAFRIETGIDVKIVRSSTFFLRKRLLSEIENANIEADVVSIADIGTFIELKNQGHIMKYSSPHYKDYPEEYQDPDYWVVFAGFGICMAYDESRLDYPPEHWMDLLDERWKGRIGLEDIRTAGSQYGQYYILRERLGKEFWEKLISRQGTKIYYTTEELTDALIEGEIDIAAEFSIHTIALLGGEATTLAETSGPTDYKINKVTSIKGIYPEEGVPFIVNPIAIMNQAEHPEEAKMFLDFLISRRGQELMQRLSYKYSIRKDVAPLEGMPPLNSLKILLPENTIDYGTKRREYIQEFNTFLEWR